MNARKFLLLFGLVLCCTAVQAAEAPVNIEADNWQADQKAGVTVYRGHVVITRGNVVIKADEVRLRTADGALQYATIIGKPATFRQTPTNAPILDGRATRIEYDAKTQIAILTGDAVLTQGGDRLHAASIKVDLDAETVLAQSDKSTPERVHVTLTPKQPPEDAAKGNDK